MYPAYYFYKVVKTLLYEKHNYLNKDISYLVSNEIIEYDISSAGFNLSKRYHLLPVDKLDFLESLDKKQRQIQLGLYQRSDESFKEKLNEKFVQIRKEFFEANNVQDDEVLSIKKDAIIMLRHCNTTEFDNVIFRDKHKYTSYYYINKFEFYVSSDGLDVKGIIDEKLALHKDYMLDFLFRFFKMMEQTSSKKKIINDLTDFSYYYKNKKLMVGYYRELNQDSFFKLNQKFLGDLLGVNDGTPDIDEIDISYNYMKYIVPLINILL